MPSSEQTARLVSAFKAVWIEYYQFGREGSVSQDIARPALAQFLVDKAREGISDEAALAEAGLYFLFSLETPPDHPVDDPASSAAQPLWSMCLENAGAQFIPMGFVRFKVGA